MVFCFRFDLPLFFLTSTSSSSRLRALLPHQNAQSHSYYAQRATSGGLLISEATNICPGAQGYPNTPGIWNDSQIESWKPVTAAVKNAAAKQGGKPTTTTTTIPATFFLQLWHTGRVSASGYQPDGGPAASASATKYKGGGGVTLPDFTTVPYETARALKIPEIKELVRSYGAAAKNAISAGFDGCECHLANGYLPEQFLRRSSNLRDDAYGSGTFESRARFALEVVGAAAEGAGGPERIGVRLSPFGQFLMGSVDEDAVEFYSYLVKELAALGIAYVHVIEPRMTEGNKEAESWDRSWSLDPLREAWREAVDGKGKEKEGGREEEQNGNGNGASSSSPPSPSNRLFIAAGGFNRQRALDHSARHPRDLIAFGRFWLSTPDLPARLEADEPLNLYDRSTFYVPDVVKGYTDYPTLAEVEKEREKYEVKEHYDGSKVFVKKEEAAVEEK